MPPLEAFGPSLAIGLILFVMLWFAIGTQRNIRKGNEVLRWLQGGLPMFGPRTTMRWLGSSAVELNIDSAKPPFRRVTAVVVLEPRDVPFLWLFARSRGRRDFLIVRADLIRAPRFSAHIWDPGGWTSRRSDLPEAGEPPETPPGWSGVLAELAPNTHEAAVHAAWDDLAARALAVWRLSVQPVVPHLEIHLRIGPLTAVGSDELIAPIQRLAVALTL